MRGQVLTSSMQIFVKTRAIALAAVAVLREDVGMDRELVSGASDMYSPGMQIFVMASEFYGWRGNLCSSRVGTKACRSSSSQRGE